MKIIHTTIALSLCLFGCADPCLNTPVDQAISPDGKLKAAIFVRDCGATSTWSTQVSIIEAGDSYGPRGNIFIVDDGHNDVERNAARGPQVDVEWTGSNRLLITYAARSRTFLQEYEFDGIAINYETRSAPHSSSSMSQ